MTIHEIRLEALTNASSTNLHRKQEHRYGYINLCNSWGKSSALPFPEEKGDASPSGITIRVEAGGRAGSDGRVTRPTPHRAMSVVPWEPREADFFGSSLQKIVLGMPQHAGRVPLYLFTVYIRRHLCYSSTAEKGGGTSAHVRGHLSHTSPPQGNKTGMGTVRIRVRIRISVRHREGTVPVESPASPLDNPLPVLHHPAPTLPGKSYFLFYLCHFPLHPLAPILIDLPCCTSPGDPSRHTPPLAALIALRGMASDETRRDQIQAGRHRCDHQGKVRYESRGKGCARGNMSGLR